ncbi:hypothetical protein CI109_101010 [Kwoniella shandongensis]|uniref:Uncharacterized protein n=1 Tax=Kwoniella shandongensis TaxID=1734106 RepID=A0A5M6C9J4_9TREE|nr:uncharacterized protein CI109_001479 [Kwoniella shandongensis]KAA5530075.1 hypothetical protein CI109_001479 [Kwoniella shandongensis]
MSDAENFVIDPPDISEELASQLELDDANKKVRYHRFMTKETQEYLKDLRPKVKGLKQFWLVTLNNHTAISPSISSKIDQHALSFLEDVELKQDIEDYREFELVFHFAENPYFNNKSLSKKFVVAPESAKAGEKQSLDEKLRTFDFTDLDPLAFEIDWKSEDKNLTAKLPRQLQGVSEGDDLEDGFEGDAGSFFWFFQNAEDTFDLGNIIRDDLLPEAFAYFEGRGPACDEDSDIDEEDDELDEESGDDDEEIDLEDEEDEPTKKKRKLGAGKR